MYLESPISCLVANHGRGSYSHKLLDYSSLTLLFFFLFFYLPSHPVPSTSPSPSLSQSPAVVASDCDVALVYETNKAHCYYPPPFSLFLSLIPL